MEPVCTWQLDAIESVAAAFLERYREHRIFAFYGEMGSGKTTFIKALCTSLNVSDLVSSPSFGLINEYLSAQQVKTYHFDFYRIEKLQEIFDIGYEDYLYSGAYCFIEWPEVAEFLLPSGTMRFRLEREDEFTRTLYRVGS